MLLKPKNTLSNKKVVHRKNKRFQSAFSYFWMQRTQVMKKNLPVYLAITLFCSLFSYGQVGIGTTTPTSTAEIVAKNPTGATTNVDGLLIPRVDRQRAQSMTGVPNSTLVYINSIATGTATGQTVNVTSIGFYYFDTTLTQWVKLETSGNNWSVLGNTGTNAGTNFLGTTDAVDLTIRTGNTSRWAVSNANSGQLQSYSLGTATLPTYSWQGDQNTGVYSPAADNLSLTTNGVEGFRIRNTSNVTIGATYAAANTAPASGLRVEGQTVINKASGEDSRDQFSAHTAAAAYSNITGYPSSASKRAIAGYANGNGIGVLGFSNNNGYGVVGLTQANTLSSFVQTGEGVLGQSDGSVATGIPIATHGIIDESAVGNWKATGVLGENNNITTGLGFLGGAYGTSGALSGVYGNIGSRVSVAGTNSYMFGVIGDVLTLGGGIIGDGTGGVLGFGGSANYGMLGYKGLTGTIYSVYGGGAAGNIAAGNTGNKNSANDANNHIGIGINGGFMGGFIQGNQYGIMTKGSEYGMYVQGNTITNKPVIQLDENGESKRTVSYNQTSTSVDITTRGTGSLRNGEAFIPFNTAFQNLVSKQEAINVTVTPTAETNGVYISGVSAEGFYVKENNKGTSNASFNWMAIGTKAGYENGVEISNEILDKNYDQNMTDVLINDETGKEEKSMYFDGKKLLFQRMPENAMQYAKKTAPKK